jgi:hypothetical protein
MLVVSDNLPIRYLRVLDCAHVLPVLLGRILSPRAVLRELQHPHTPAVVRTWLADLPGWKSALSSGDQMGCCPRWNLASKKP